MLGGCRALPEGVRESGKYEAENDRADPGGGETGSGLTNASCKEKHGLVDIQSSLSRYLVVIIDTNLSFSEHLDYSCQTAASATATLAKILL